MKILNLLDKHHYIINFQFQRLNMAIMGVQSLATQRNAQVEIFIDYIINETLAEIRDAGIISQIKIVERQKRFTSELSSDIFDNFFSVVLPDNTIYNFYAQTTCYKGNKSGRPEPNKTYEIRETLIETLSLRQCSFHSESELRTLHFTIGSEKYTYDWFKDVKASCFDLSLYLPSEVDSEHIFDKLSTLFVNLQFEFEFTDALNAEQTNKTSALTTTVNHFKEKLTEWFVNGCNKSFLADKQTQLLSTMYEKRKKQFPALLEASISSANIKTETLNILNGSSTPSPIYIKTLKRLYENNPFLTYALELEASWLKKSQKIFSIPDDATIESYICALWNRELPVRLVTRRLLLRIHTETSINYIQDLDVAGITEHNLYSGNHNHQQVTSIVEIIVKNCKKNRIDSPSKLYDVLTSNIAKNIIVSSRKFEGANGTNIKPTLFYIEEVLKPKYTLKRFQDTKLPVPIAYYAKFCSSTVMPYQNMAVVVNENNNAVAILKAKFFNKPEFPRRCKEEAFVGLTAKYDYIENEFQQKYVGIPFVMFVDKSAGFTPPAYSILRLFTSGWELAFTSEQLISMLDSFNEKYL